MREDIEEDMIEEDEIESGMDDLEEEDAKPKKRKAKKIQRQTTESEEDEEGEAREIWEPFHAPEMMGLRNTVTGQEIQGFGDIGMAQAMAVLLNAQERIGNALGN